jgi:hypothetical protein
MKQKLIMETWRKFVEQQAPSLLIYENRGTIRRLNFDNLLEDVRSGKTAPSQAYFLFERSFEYGERQLLEEGLMDLIAQGYDKAGKVAGELGDKIKAAWQRANDFYLDMVLKAIKLAQAGGQKFAKYASKIFAAIDKFKEKHPILYKVIYGMLIALIIYSVFGSSNAQAAVKVGGVQLDDTTYQAIQGALNDAARDPDYAMVIGKAQVAFERAHSSGATVDLKDLAPAIQGAFDVVDQTLTQAAGGDSDAASLFNKWIKVGESLRLQATNF